MSMNTRRYLAAAAAVLLAGGAAEAQTAPGDPGKGYAEFVAQSAFGNVTSQNYGAEFGFTVTPTIQVFAEIGHTRNVATAEISASAQTMAGALARTQSNVSYSVEQPLTFGVGGIKYLLPVSGQKLLPYFMLGFGVAKVNNDVAFSIGGSDVTSNLGQYGIILGTDLSGGYTKPILTFGGGVMYPVWESLVLDFQYRYGHVFAEGGAINSNRAGVGLGFRF
jgi:opacity protein-like surface antigen